MLEEEELAEAVTPVRASDTIEASEAAREAREAGERKAAAAAALIERYAKGDAKVAARLERVLVSIADDEALTLAHVRPIEEV